MKRLIVQTLMAAAIGGTVLSAAPANAASVSISIGFPGVGFSYNSGGYCDSWGCPRQFWNYPIYYCPVYYGGRWYSGPVYYRYSGGRYQYWIRGGWRRDFWNRPRPRGACVDRYGPPLDLDFYIWNGFNVRDQWRYSWRNQRNDWWNHRQEWDRSHRGDASWQNWVPTPQRNYDWNRQRDWNSDREWTRPDWNRRDWERKYNINRGTNVGPTPPMSPSGAGGPPTNGVGPVTPPPQMAPTVTPPTMYKPPADTGGHKRDERKGGTQGGTATPPSQTTPAFTPPADNKPPANVGGHTPDGKKGTDHQGTRGTKRGKGTPPTQTITPGPTQPAAESPPADEGKDHRKPKDDKDKSTTDSNSPQ